MPARIVWGWLHDPDSFWFKVHAWDPSADADLVRGQLERLRGFARRHGTRLFAVNLPEHRWNREGYRPGRYETYMSLVRGASTGRRSWTSASCWSRPSFTTWAMRRWRTRAA
jgi:hypothetical protein